MVYCRYCGVQNKHGDLKCSNCGKPLPLMANEPHSNMKRSQNNAQNLKSNNPIDNQSNNYSIKDKYLRDNQDPQNIHNNQRNNQNIDYDQNYQNQQYQNQQYQNQQNYQNQQQYNQNYQRHQNQEYSDGLHNNEFNQQYQQNYTNKHKRVSKTAIEWDVVIATALMVIILTAILQRIFPMFAIFISLLIGLAYILVATKSKSSLVKSIPLTILVILSISSYFSL